VNDNLPASRDAELAILACVWQQPDLTTTLGIQPGDLYGTDTEALWNAITTLHDDGITPDPIVVLRRVPKAQRDNVNQLIIQHIIGTPAIPSNAPAYAAEIRDLADRRNILAATERIRQIVNNPDATPDAINEALSQLTRTTQRNPAGGPQTTIERYPALDLRELLRPDRPPREYVIEGLLPARASTALVAPAGVGKSLLALGAAIHVSQGRRHFAGFDIPRPRHVLYIDLENTTDDLAERFEDYGLKPDDSLTNLTYLSLPQLPPLDTAEGGRDLAAILDAYKLTPGDLVIVDSYQRVISGEENKSDTARAYYTWAGIELKRRGLSVLRLDNTGKDTTRGARGTSSKQDDVDIELVMTRDADDPDKYHLEVTKGRMGDYATRLTITRDRTADTITWSTGGDPFRSYVNECKDFLDQIGVPIESGERPAYAAVHAAGRRFTRPVVRAAVKERKGRSLAGQQPAEHPAEQPAQVRQTTTAHPDEHDRATDSRRTPAQILDIYAENPSHKAEHTSQGAPTTNSASRRTATLSPAPSAAISREMAQGESPSRNVDKSGREDSNEIPLPRSPHDAGGHDVGSPGLVQRDQPLPRDIRDAGGSETSRPHRASRTPGNESFQLPSGSGRTLACRTCGTPMTDLGDGSTTHPGCDNLPDWLKEN
jgi:hypothetical protein